MVAADHDAGARARDRDRQRVLGAFLERVGDGAPGDALARRLAQHRDRQAGERADERAQRRAVAHDQARRRRSGSG